MLAKWWKKIGLIILIIFCIWNVTSKIVKRVSFDDNVKSTVKSFFSSEKEDKNDNKNQTENIK